MLELKSYKNYKELCVALGWKITSGDAKKRQIEHLDSFCKYYKEGNKYVITEIFAEQKEIEDGRKNNSGRKSTYGHLIKKGKESKEIEDKKKNNKGKEPKYYPQFLLQKEDWYKTGVYKIQFENKVYIGSTKNFRKRYIQHLKIDEKGLPCVYELLKENKHVFEILELVGEEKELEIREQYWLDKYAQSERYEVINQRRAKAIKPISESVNRIIRISKKEYEYAVKLLKDNGFNVL